MKDTYNPDPVLPVLLFFLVPHLLIELQDVNDNWTHLFFTIFIFLVPVIVFSPFLQLLPIYSFLM